LEAGVHLASRYIADPGNEWVFDYLPEPALERLDNISDFARMLGTRPLDLERRRAAGSI